MIARQPIRRNDDKEIKEDWIWVAARGMIGEDFITMQVCVLLPAVSAAGAFCRL